MRTILLIQCLLCINNFVSAQVLDSLVGVPYFKIMTDSEMRKIIINSFSDLSHLGGSEKDNYNKYKKHKALAVRYGLSGFGRPSYYIDGYGLSWEEPSVEKAKQRALDELKLVPNYSGNKSVIFLKIDDEDIPLPDSLLKEFRKMVIDINNDHLRRFGLANKTVPLNEAADQTIYMVDVQNGFLGNHSDSIRLTPHFPVNIGYPDRYKDYAQACQGRIFYALQPINQMDTAFYNKRLRQLSRRGLYGVYNRSVNTVMNYKVEVKDRQTEKIAKFNSHLFVKRDSIKINLPLNIKNALKNEIIQEMWVEGTVRITDNGIPLEKDTLVRPLAILTNRNFYIAIEIRMPDTEAYCAISQDFHGKILDITPYKNDEISRQRVYTALMNNMIKQFSNTPFIAQKIEKPYPPGELWMIRDGLPSLILGGSYYESTTYTFKVYYANDGPGGLESMYNLQAFKGVSKKDVYSDRVYLFLEVNNVSTSKGHKNDSIYIEIDKDQQSKYFKEINDAITRVVTKTCEELKGQLRLSLCEIKP